MRKPLSTVLVILFAAFLVSGCAGTKKPFTEVMEIPQSKGVVYIYMPKKGNIAKDVDVAVDNSEGIGIKLGELKRQHHMTYFAPIGENLFKIGNSAISINVQNGMSYFIKMTSYKFFTYRFKLINVDPTAGFHEIRKTQAQTIMMY